MKGMIYSVVVAAVLTVAGSDVTKGEFGAKRSDAVETERKERSKPEAKAKASRNSYPFHGTLDSLDGEKRTITLKGKKKNRVILLSEDTRFFRNGVKAVAEDARAGERVTGTVRKNAEGKEVALTVRFGGNGN